MTGANAINQFGTYGTKGTPAAANTPGGLSGAATWTDAAGNLWLWGGYGYLGASAGYSNDMWKYDASTGYWTWIHGDNTANKTVVYTDPDPTKNVSGSRANSVTWKDASGNFWLFGGYGYSTCGCGETLNDLWKYDPTANTWTYIRGWEGCCGSSVATYGTKGTPAAGNTPGGRSNATAWKDAFGNFWLFGGYGYNNTASTGYLNDMWRYNPTTNEWTWMSEDNTLNNGGIYGTVTVPATTNKPGARNGAVGWKDNAGQFWMHGGGGYSSVNGGCGSYAYLNDLWGYEPSTNLWTWMKTDTTRNNYRIYGTQGTSAPTNNPGSVRYGNGWADASGNLWLFGGDGLGVFGWGRLNGLWKFSRLLLPLPIELLSFDATPVKDNNGKYYVRCAWSTASEINNDYFTIERSQDGKIFADIGTKKGAGNSKNTLYYKFDNQLPYTDLSHYRLKQTDYNGKFSYSNIVSVYIGSLDLISISPNPAIDNFEYKIGSTEKTSVSVKVVDILGQIVINKTEIIEKGITSKSMNVSELSSGTYILQIITENKEVIGKQFQIK